MNSAAAYARALKSLVEQKPDQSTAYLANLRGALVRRGHSKLLPRILSEYQRLEAQSERSARYKVITPQMERTRILLELYQKLITTE